MTIASASGEVARVERWDGASDFKATVKQWAEKMRVEPTRIQLQHMARKWASCSPNGALTFNVELLEEDRRFGEAVIVHELIHLTVPNHGRLFRSLLMAYMPDSDEILNGRLGCAYRTART
jgi:predicted metal-dependent hydrolase